MEYHDCTTAGLSTEGQVRGNAGPIVGGPSRDLECIGISDATIKDYSKPRWDLQPRTRIQGYPEEDCSTVCSNKDTDARASTNQNCAKKYKNLVNDSNSKFEYNLPGLSKLLLVDRSIVRLDFAKCRRTKNSNLTQTYIGTVTWFVKAYKNWCRDFRLWQC